MFTWLEGSCTSPLAGSTPGGKCDWIYVFMHVGVQKLHLDFFVFVSKIDAFIRICKYRERLLHLRSIVHQWQRHLLQVRAGKEIVLKKSNCNKKATVLKKREIVLQKNNCVTTKEISKLKLLKLFWNLKYQHNGLSSLGSNGTNIKFQIYPKHIQPRHKTNKGSFHSLPFFLKIMITHQTRLFPIIEKLPEKLWEELVNWDLSSIGGAGHTQRSVTWSKTLKIMVLEGRGQLAKKN